MSGHRCCPTCGANIGTGNLCLACGFKGCEDNDHSWMSAGDPSVGIPWHSECRECGMTDDADLSDDDIDIDDDYSGVSYSGLGEGSAP
jgi:hypothetical protein